MVDRKQLGKNIGDVFRGAYHGSSASAIGVGEALDGAIMEFITLGEDQPSFKYSSSHVSKVPHNKYGISSAVVSGLATLGWVGFLMYNLIGTTVDVLAGYEGTATEQSSNSVTNLEVSN